MRRALFVLSAFLIATPALAQDSAMNDRLLRLERDVNFLQREVYANGAGGSAAAPVEGAGAAQIQVRLSQLDEEIRRLRGEVEQAQYLAGENRRELLKLKEDIDYRLQALEQAQPVSAAMGGEAAPAAEAPAAAAAEEAATYQPEPKKEERAVTGADFPDSNSAYNAAFKLLNGKKYSEAATAFDGFVKKYPKDPLTSNAYYWLGESYYARGDYTRAAEGFRKGFESNAQGQKAPDNLLKLALSLDKIKRSSEACIVLSQVVTKYGEQAPRTAQRAESERTRMQCK